MIRVRVQHHPSRAHLLPRLLAALSPLATEVVAHASDPPDPWAGYRFCLSDIPECSHLLVIQDDALPCRNFPAALEAVADAQPEALVCLYLGGLPSPAARQAAWAMQKGERFIPLGLAQFLPIVAVLWPRRKAQSFEHWARSAKGMTRADDGNAGKWVRRTKQEVMVAVPSLVQHDDAQPSVKGGREHVPWKERWRQAAFLSEDGSEFLSPAASDT